MLPRLLDYSRKRRRTFKVPMPQNKRLQVRRDWSPNWPPPGIPLFSGLLDRGKIGVVFIACTLRARVRVALICIMRRAAGDFLNDLIYQAGFILRVSSTVCGLLCERERRYKHECCRGQCCYELHEKSPVVRMYRFRMKPDEDCAGLVHERRLA